ncbi:MAG: tRNA dihydrouridine(20/20a) synthase DusA [Rhizobiaceae bacterium]
MYHKSLKNKEKIFAVAPMMDWTDRHCRVFHRQLSRRALLYSEMVVADAVIQGDRDKLLGFFAEEHPLALQLGGSDPQKLAQAARIGEDYGYDEINLNVGCPSDRVQSGTFGACLMLVPTLVGECVAAMKASVSVPVTVKCRLGVDEQDTGPALDALAHAVWNEGCDALWVHARKAWLQGLSPKENRSIPPLDHARVRRLKGENPSRFIGLNGGLETVNQALDAVRGEGVELDGTMLGRAAYHNPQILREVDALFYGEEALPASWADVIACMADHADRHIRSGGRLNHVTRHMINLFNGRAGARRWRQILTVRSVEPGADGRVIHEAFDAVSLDASEKAA